MTLIEDEWSVSTALGSADITAHTLAEGPSERAALRDEIAYSRLASTLAGDDHWWWVVDQMRPHLPRDHPELGSRRQLELWLGGRSSRERRGLVELVRPYCRKHMPAQAMFILMALLAGVGHPRALGKVLMLNLPRTGWYDDAPLVPGDSQRASQQRRVEQLEVGVAMVVRRGAGLCSRCGTRLVPPRESGRWRNYCAGCTAGADWQRDRHAVQYLLDAASGVVFPRSSRIRERRVSRAA